MQIRARCSVCDTLRRAAPLALGLGKRECEYAPLDHDKPDKHVECGGTVEYEARNCASGLVDEHGDPTFVEYFVANCSRCGLLSEDADVIRSHEPCPGSRKPIR